MSHASQLNLLRIALVVIGLACIIGEYTLSIVWPSGWTWGHGHSHYLTMIIGIYAYMRLNCPATLRYFTSSIVEGSHSAIPGNIATSTTAMHIRKNSGSA